MTPNPNLLTPVLILETAQSYKENGLGYGLLLIIHMGSSKTVETELVGKDKHTLSAEQGNKLFGTKKINEKKTHSWLHDRHVGFVFSIKEENLTMKTSLIEYAN